MKTWKPLSLCLLLVLSVVSYVAASPAPAALPNGGAVVVSATSATSATAPASAAAPLAALWATDAQTVGGPFAPLAKTCTLHSCMGTGACLCPNGTVGHCVAGNCNF